MSREVRREVKASERFLDRLDGYLGPEVGRPSLPEVLLREIIPHVFEAFRQDWDDFDSVAGDARVRFYAYAGDLIPFAIFTGKLTAMSVQDDFYLVEHIELVDVQMDFEDDLLEDPADPSPDR